MLLLVTATSPPKKTRKEQGSKRGQVCQKRQLMYAEAIDISRASKGKTKWQTCYEVALFLLLPLKMLPTGVILRSLTLFTIENIVVYNKFWIFIPPLKNLCHRAWIVIPLSEVFITFSSFIFLTRQICRACFTAWKMPSLLFYSCPYLFYDEVTKNMSPIFLHPKRERERERRTLIVISRSDKNRKRGGFFATPPTRKWEYANF